MNAKADIVPLIDGELERVIAAEARARGYTHDAQRSRSHSLRKKTAQRLADLVALAEAGKGDLTGKKAPLLEYPGCRLETFWRTGGGCFLSSETWAA